MTTHQLVEALEGLLVAALLVPLERLVQWLQAALRALERALVVRAG